MSNDHTVAAWSRVGPIFIVCLSTKEARAGNREPQSLTQGEASFFMHFFFCFSIILFYSGDLHFNLSARRLMRSMPEYTPLHIMQTTQLSLV